MKTSLFSKLSLALCITALCGASTAFGQTNTYRQTSGTGLNVSFATSPFVLDDVNLVAGSTAVRQILTSLTFGVGVAPGTAAQTGAAFLDFYDTVNMASTGPVESDYIGGFGGTFSIAANTGATTAFVAYTFNGLDALTNPIYFNDPNIGVVLTLTNSTGQFYSTVVTPLMSAPGAPTIGSSVTGVYRDTSGNNEFESTELNPTMGNLYLSLVTKNAAPIPEPTTMALLAFGGVAGLVAYKRRKM